MKLSGGSKGEELVSALNAVAPGLADRVDRLAKMQSVMHEFRLPDEGVFLSRPPGIDINSSARFDDYNAGTTQHIWNLLGGDSAAQDAMMNMPAFGELVS